MQKNGTKERHFKGTDGILQANIFFFISLFKTVCLFFFNLFISKLCHFPILVAQLYYLIKLPDTIDTILTAKYPQSFQNTSFLGLTCDGNFRQQMHLC